MQQRRLRLGDILDDYCPRERRITNHAVVAMIDDEVKQTRCTTCDAEHEYKQARVPTPRRKKGAGVLAGEAVEGVLRRRPTEPHEEPEQIEGDFDMHDEAEPGDSLEAGEAPLEAKALTEGEAGPEEHAGDTDALDEGDEDNIGNRAEEDGPVHRRLIRATLPRPEGQAPERKNPEFTIHTPQGRGPFNGNARGRRGRGGMRAGGAGGGGGPMSRFGAGGSRQGQGARHGSGQGQRTPGNRPGHPGGNRGGGRGPQGRGPGGGRKRGR